jgi:hypothetical protein
MKNRGPRNLLAAFLAAVFILTAVPAQAIGLRTKFGKVQVRGLKIGQTYSLNKLLSLPYRLVNTGGRTEEVRLDVVPLSGEPQPGYEPIPDVNWVTLEKHEFSVAPNHEAVSDVIISIPNDAKLLGKRYEVHLWAHTTAKEGMFNVGLESSLLLEIASVPPTEEELKKKFVDRRVANLDFTLYPTEGLAEDVPLGKDFDLKKERKMGLKLVNPNDQKLNFRVRALPRWETVLTLPEGFEDPPSFNWVRPSTDTVVMEGNSIKETGLFIDIPDQERYRGKSYLFVLSVEVLEQEIPTRVFYRLLVKTQKASVDAKKEK